MLGALYYYGMKLKRAGFHERSRDALLVLGKTDIQVYRGSLLRVSSNLDQALLLLQALERDVNEWAVKGPNVVPVMLSRIEDFRRQYEMEDYE